MISVESGHILVVSHTICTAAEPRKKKTICDNKSNDDKCVKVIFSFRTLKLCCRRELSNDRKHGV